MSLANRLAKIQVVKKPKMPGRIGSHDHRRWQHTKVAHSSTCGSWNKNGSYGLSNIMASQAFKPNHRLVCKYVEMQVELAENWNHHVPVYPTVRDVTSENVNLQANPKPRAKLMPAKTKSQSAPSYVAAIDMEEDGLNCSNISMARL